MEITIKYFGQLVETTNTTEELITIEKGQISSLLNLLLNKHKGLKQKDFQIAQNQEIVSVDTELSGAEIALLPPFSGG
ncbi:hypothetical protein PK35_03935 [Tamlana nanhaiensis]|uniref:MoaD/ThiS family protein n=1 Tax=Neotamlana nanhaiensis TaxID=1382798 RepID=A0A0D7W4F4_9FLAO|nr:MoaD/ThiS family protein [Tamlana nanhaiensis]KJD33899.1 hypothetical protein PK35_03935 [Tamlana nanhaiensis]